MKDNIGLHKTMEKISKKSICRYNLYLKSTKNVLFSFDR